MPQAGRHSRYIEGPSGAIKNPSFVVREGGTGLTSAASLASPTAVLPCSGAKEEQEEEEEALAIPRACNLPRTLDAKRWMVIDRFARTTSVEARMVRTTTAVDGLDT